MYRYKLRKSLEKKFFKIAKKDPKMLRIIYKKIREVIKNPNHYKNLRKPLQHLKRIHIDRSFVLVFSIHEDIVMFEDFNHHDNIYD